MLVLVTMFLVTAITSAVAVWGYRKLSGWQGFTETVASRPRSSRRMQIGAQQGFISLASKRAKKPITVKLRSPKGNIKAPWGW
jgi:hypothetical protein